jgi:hypothetical protein
MKFIIKILSAILFAVLMSSGISYATGFDPACILGALLSCSLIPFVPSGVLAMAVQVEIWQNHIEEEIFKDNPHLNLCVNEDEYVIGGKVVHIPQSGGSGNIEKNRSAFPANIRRRNDTDVVYVLDEYTSDPVAIPDADKKELSFDKRQSVLNEDLGKMKEVIGDDMFYKWAKDLPESNIILTTGEQTDATADDATGKRLALMMKDLQKAATKLNKMGVAKNERYAAIPSEIMAGLFPPESEITARYMALVTEEERKQGIIAVVQGFKLLDRPTVLTYATDGTLKPIGAATAATDDEGIFCWQKNAVARSLGDTEFFEDEGNPTHYADIYSMLNRMGGRRRRKDNKGVVVIKQAKP